MFWIILQQDRGFIRFKLFGQKCQKCNTDDYENAMWYPEEVDKVIVTLMRFCRCLCDFKCYANENIIAKLMCYEVVQFSSFLARP